MVDYAWEEIKALEDTWPAIRVFLCGFHREQSWMRWSSKSTVSDIPRDPLLRKFRAVANAASEEQLEEALISLQEWQFYSGTPVKQYFEKFWLSEIRSWALVYKPLDLLFDTNNGIERVHKELKYNYLQDKNCSLSELLQLLVEKFLPDRFSGYLCDNIAMLSSHKQYSSALHPNLQQRPKWIIEHILKKMSAFNQDVASQVFRVDSNIFHVPSDAHVDMFYAVSS